MKRDRRKSYIPLFSSYVVILALVLIYYTANLSVIGLAVPLLMVLTPVLLHSRIHVDITLKDSAKAVIISYLFLIPFIFTVLVTGGEFSLPGPSTLAFHLFVASIPEEVYFRGFLQEKAGNTLWGVVITSLAFTVMHSPRYFIGGDVSALLTFFPSLVMGWLYMKKRNLLYPVIFHFLSNILIASIL